MLKCFVLALLFVCFLKKKVDAVSGELEMRQKTEKKKRNRAPPWHLMRLKSSTYEDHAAKILTEAFEAPKNGIQDSPSVCVMFKCAINVPVLFSMHSILSYHLQLF